MIIWWWTTLSSYSLICLRFVKRSNNIFAALHIYKKNFLIVLERIRRILIKWWRKLILIECKRIHLLSFCVQSTSQAAVLSRHKSLLFNIFTCFKVLHIRIRFHFPPSLIRIFEYALFNKTQIFMGVIFCLTVWLILMSLMKLM